MPDTVRTFFAHGDNVALTLLTLAALVALLLLGWLLMVAWPVLPAGGRALRVTTIALVLGYAVYKIRH